MASDYYKVLQVDRGASDDDLKKSYRKLAMKWHPDKNPSNKKQAEANFKRISEAYDVLSDPVKRKIYDLYGEDGLRGQVPSPSSAGSGPGPRRSADEIFSEFFGFPEGAGGHRGGGSGGRGRFQGGIFGEDMFSSFGSSVREGRGGEENGTAGPTMLRKGPQIERTVGVSLEDLYKGAVKKLKISRDVVDSIGRPKTVEEILMIDIKPGWKKGTKITFPEKGNEHHNQIPSDLVFTIDEKPHPVFKREGNDLIFTQKLMLIEALTGFTVQLTTLDGRTLCIPINSIINPNYEEIVQGEGMPITKDQSKKGNLRIRFQIKFPTRLSPDQKSGLKETLS